MKRELTRNYEKTDESPNENGDNTEEDQNEKSKSQVKREMQALRRLGDSLVRLSAEQLAQLPIEEKLLDAIKATHAIYSHGALKRQSQLLGKIIRHTDVSAIQEALAAMEAKQKGQTQEFHEIERWRDRLIQAIDSKAAVKEFMDHYPATDSQHLRQLIRKAQHDSSTSTAGAYRQLFRYLREQVTNNSDDSESQQV